MDQLCCVLGCSRGLLRQISYFFCHHGKSLPGSAGSGSLHRCIQGQNVSLEGNVLDRLDDISDFAGAAPDLRHCGQRLLHLLVAVHDFTAHRHRLFADIPRMLRIALYMLQNVRGRGRQFLNGGCLLRGALRHRLSAYRCLL